MFNRTRIYYHVVNFILRALNSILSDPEFWMQVIELLHIIFHSIH